MISRHQQDQFRAYGEARAYFVANPQLLIRLEKVLTVALREILTDGLDEIRRDYDEASLLYPFWKHYPPDHRGRAPVGDQYPWIEVGEHAIGCKLPRLLAPRFGIRDTGLPTGSDQRFVVTSDAISRATGGFTNAAWLFIDIKSVGPRDDQPHTVMSHNQVSGNGIWKSAADGVTNGILTATGLHASHDFHATLPPIYVLSDGTVAPIVSIALKPVYKMLPPEAGAQNSGQPLGRIDIASIPNGILLTVKPNYLAKYPGLLFPGKDDKSKNPKKLRARISFDILAVIDKWRIQSIAIADR